MGLYMRGGNSEDFDSVLDEVMFFVLEYIFV